MDKAWFLESVAADGSRLTRTIDKLPFKVGRDPSSDLSLDARGLSRQHAVFSLTPSGLLLLTDQGSTNGTYVNRERIRGSRVVGDNDVIHFGNAEFRLAGETDSQFAARVSPDSGHTLLAQDLPGGGLLSQNFVRHERQFMELLQGQGLSAAVQPIVHLQSGKLYAYELLGRSTHPDLPENPVPLFHLATMLDREAELSDAFRRYGVSRFVQRLGGVQLFINTHPSETFSDSLMQALTALRSQPQAPELVVEVHESAITDVQRLKTLAARLQAIGVRFAYDDFGAGQARLSELGDVPPHFVKFDMGLIRGLHEATEGKRKVVRDLVRLVIELGSVPLAEGVEQQAEADACRDMGFELVQGFLTGAPVPLASV